MKILIRSGKTEEWTVVESASYSAEAELQNLLASSPSLLPLDEIRVGTPSPVFAVQEFELPGSGYVDILAFTSDGEIVLVECKLAANPEVKRKVIGQILEYSAYLWTMSYEELDARVQSMEAKSLASAVSEKVEDPDWDQESFRAGIERSLRSGGFFLIIAVDSMNDELSRTLQYLNRGGDLSFHFCAPEMHRYKSGDVEMLVPRLYGPAAQTGKPPGTTKQWTEERFLRAVKEQLPSSVADVIRSLYEWSIPHADRVWFGTGTETGSFTFHYLVGGRTASVFTVYTNGKMSINYGWLSNQIKKDHLQSFHEDIVQIECFKQIPPDFTKWPTVTIVDDFWGQPDGFDAFKTTVQKLGRKIKNDV